MLRALDFNVTTVSPYWFLSRYSKILRSESPAFFLAQYLTELSMLDLKMLRFKPSQIAGGALYLANRLLKIPAPWPSFITQHSGYSHSHVKEVALEQYLLYQKVEGNKQHEALKKKFSLSRFGEVAKLAFEQRPRSRREDISTSATSTHKSTV